MKYGIDVIAMRASVMNCLKSPGKLLLLSFQIALYVADRSTCYDGILWYQVPDKIQSSVYVRGLFIVPILLFDGGSAGSAMRASRALTSGPSWRPGAAVVGWHAGREKAE